MMMKHTHKYREKARKCFEFVVVMLLQKKTKQKETQKQNITII